MEVAGPSMREAAGLLETYADEVRRLTGRTRRHRQWNSSRWSGNSTARWTSASRCYMVTPSRDANGLDILLQKAINAIGGAISVFEQLSAAEDTLPRAAATSPARPGRSCSVRRSVTFDTVLLANQGIGGTLPGLDNGILAAPQPETGRRHSRRDCRLAERAKVQAPAGPAGSEAQKHILKALAAGLEAWPRCRASPTPSGAR